ncbi:hypothetical protein BISA_1928 [Bifidobacterium saguini DSM 23967]|uniref:BIG2 domain-containing protein n=2 Tax=Bifidobacterium saguini TaxID=762210 RepID=A0A087D5Z9_9BIFI|nr:hypothetical protein [Bifidobacterium saguini]KFI90949.1 hypothetical protein BISA_1928 [Bifidobacterium saguini DSM 23967]QTB91441.1 hypothetical protein BSD967_03190 [Bifidobacterium saguini]
MTPTGIKATPESLTVRVGETASIEATVTPATAPQTVAATTNGTDLIGIKENQ